MPAPPSLTLVRPLAEWLSACVGGFVQPPDQFALLGFQFLDPAHQGDVARILPHRVPVGHVLDVEPVPITPVAMLHVLLKEIESLVVPAAGDYQLLALGMGVARQRSPA